VRSELLDAWLFPPLPCDASVFLNLLFDEQKGIGLEFVSRLQEKRLCREVERGPFTAESPLSPPRDDHQSWILLAHDAFVLTCLQKSQEVKKRPVPPFS